MVELSTVVYAMAFIGGAACGVIGAFVALLFTLEVEE